MSRSVLSSFLDFDEQTADDWDVDMSVYYDKGISVMLCITLINKRNQTMKKPCRVRFSLTQFFFLQMEVIWMLVTMSKCGMKKG